VHGEWKHGRIQLLWARNQLLSSMTDCSIFVDILRFDVYVEIAYRSFTTTDVQYVLSDCSSIGQLSGVVAMAARN
jgi:hypothetical protein